MRILKQHAACLRNGCGFAIAMKQALLASELANSEKIGNSPKFSGTDFY
jgi:hypothetical protein